MKYYSDYQTVGRHNFGTQTRLILTQRTQGLCLIYICIYLGTYQSTNTHTHTHTHIYIYIYAK